MRKVRVVLVALMTILGCDETTPPPPVIPFSLLITVVDPSGQPVSGLQVGAFNHVPNFVLPDGPGLCSDPIATFQSPSRAITTIHLISPQASIVTLTIRDWSSQTVRKLVTDHAVDFPGTLTMVWNGLDDDSSPVPYGVYRVRVTARSAAGVEVFNKERLAVVLPTSSLATGYIGLTSAEGTVETKNMLQFPGILDVPPISATDQLCNVVEDFEITNSLTVRLYDPTLQKQLYVCDALSMTTGANEVTVVWDPNAATALVEPEGPPGSQKPMQLLPDSDTQAAWDFSICPNPFQ